MHTSLAVRRPITSPCLLCVLRAAATTEQIPRRRRLHRRVHTSANRRAGENLAARPEPEDEGHYNIATRPTSQLQGFGASRSASLAASRWTIKKPQAVVQQPPPPPVPVPILPEDLEPQNAYSQSTVVEQPRPYIRVQSSAVHTQETQETGLHAATQSIDFSELGSPIDNQAPLSPAGRPENSQKALLHTEPQSIETSQSSSPIDDAQTPVNATVQPGTSEASETHPSVNIQAQAQTIPLYSNVTPEIQINTIPRFRPQAIEETSFATQVPATQTQDIQENPKLSQRVFKTPVESKPSPSAFFWGHKKPSTNGSAHASAHGLSANLSWAQRELSASAAPVPRDPASSPSPHWSQWEPGISSKKSYDLYSSQEDTKALRAKHLQQIVEGETSQHLPRNQDPPARSHDLKYQFGNRSIEVAAPSKPIWNSSTNNQSSLGASKGASKWGTSKKSVFAATDTNSILDQLTGKQPTPVEIISPKDSWNSSSVKDAYGFRGSSRDSGRERSFMEFKTTPVPSAQTMLSNATSKDPVVRFDIIEDALEEAKLLEDAILGVGGRGKKLKKKDRRKAETAEAKLVANSEPSEPSAWDRRASAKERDKEKHSRKWVTDPLEEDDMEVESKADRKERKRLEREQKAKEKEQEQQYPPILIPEFVSVSALARLCKVKYEKFTMKMLDLGFTETNPDFVLNAEMAGLIAMEYGFEPIVDKSHERDLSALPVPADKSAFPPRPPVVTIMGHVDHGKTTILDWLRKSSIVDQEHGGITQHIGAFSVNMPSGRVITFLDTPGHEAFLKMRERGANVTDIVILVVAADDSIMPQTIEAIRHAKSAGVPIIVAVNKCDKEDANPEKVKADLATHDIHIEDVGGDTQVVCVSGKTGLGMEDLEEAVLLQADDIDMRAEKTGRIEGWVVETTTRSKGRVATILVRRGTLRRGDVIVAGKTWARVRNLITENGVEIDEAPPGTPVEIDGWRDQPDAGDEVLQAENEEKAKSVVEYRLFKEERLQLAKDIEAINEQRRLHHEKKEREARLKELQENGVDAAAAELEVAPLQEEKFKILEVPFIIKADVAGSVEAVAAQVLSVANEEARTKVIRMGVGPLVESDVAMAETTGAYCLTFNVSNDPDILAMARYSNVKVIPHTVIYAILDDIKRLMSDKLKPIILKSVVGEAEILKVFQYNVRKRVTRPFAGCRVTRGMITKGFKAKVMRKGETVYDGEIETLKNIKKDVKEMAAGTECGMGFLNFDDIKEGDTIQCYTETKKKRTFD
ncbi:hypothetical protein ABW20_dc0108686 [Dactylellina cionopaga]|nr:hypothetical protein ABW20_dc0108686 [Dactylellina cionopaga]